MEKNTNNILTIEKVDQLNFRADEARKSDSELA
jgi:hypothetical protein